MSRLLDASRQATTGAPQHPPAAGRESDDRGREKLQGTHGHVGRTAAVGIFDAHQRCECDDDGDTCGEYANEGAFQINHRRSLMIGGTRRAQKPANSNNPAPSPTCHHSGPSTHLVPWNQPWLYFRSQPMRPATKKSSPPNPTENTRWYCQP